ncbi:MAG: hypothetical protein HKN29_13270 [Rhodothermales bacterium]|nr:hypothetical protein [Rhodothermales bacterium]
MKQTLLFITAISLASLNVALAQSGHVMNGVGPIDQGMSGAGMAAPQDALTALHWNPASLFAVSGRSLDIGLQIMKPTGSVRSTVDVGAFGQLPNFLDPTGPPMVPYPWASLDGTTDSDPGVFPIPSIGFVQSSEDSRFAFGFSAFGVGGFGVDYAGSPMPLGSLPDNAILSPQRGELGMGFGALASEFMLLQASPTIAYKINDRVSVGIAPTFNLAALDLSVFPATAPTFVNTPLGPQPMYPDAPRAWATGIGFQAGVQANTAAGLQVGLSFKSPQKFGEFEYSPELTGAPDYSFQMDYPMIISGAVAYTGVEGLLLAGDVRYIDFENTEGFSETGFDQMGAVRGFGWSSITVVAVGAQYEVAEDLPVRVGYSYNPSPIDESTAFFNSPAPAIVSHHVSGGFSYMIREGLQFSLAAQFGLENDVTGNWMTIDPGTGATVGIPGTTITNTLSTLTVIGGVHLSL